MRSRVLPSVEWAAMLLVAGVLGLTAIVAAQPPRQPPLATQERQAPQAKPPAPPRQMAAMPKPGPCPLPTLPALAPSTDSTFDAVAAVPHGKVEQIPYKNFAGADKRMHVYLPPSYEKDAGARYPVLYLCHGGGDNDAGWTLKDARKGGRADYVLDNLIAAVEEPVRRGVVFSVASHRGHLVRDGRQLLARHQVEGRAHDSSQIARGS